MSTLTVTTGHAFASLDETDVDVRAELSRVTGGNRLAEAVITYITGKPAHGETPLITLSPLQLYGASTLALATSVASTYAAFAYLPLPLAIAAGSYSMLWTTGRLRAQQVVFGHYGTHEGLSRNKKVNQLVGDVATTLALAQNPNEFRVDHLAHHSDRVFTRATDPDAAFLKSLGFVPGMPVAEAWALLRRTIISPRFHGLFISSRLRSGFITASPRRRLMSIAMVGALGALAATTPWWMFALAVILPLGPMYNISALLQFLSEHKWLHEEDGKLTLEQYKAACWGRFCGEAPPSQALRGRRGWLAGTWWAGRLLFVHLPTRLGILVGDLPAHDWHHLRSIAGSGPMDWVNGNYARQASIERGDPAGFARREIWGLGNMIRAVFAGLSQSKTA